MRNQQKKKREGAASEMEQHFQCTVTGSQRRACSVVWNAVENSTKVRIETVAIGLSSTDVLLDLEGNFSVVLEQKPT